MLKLSVMEFVIGAPDQQHMRDSALCESTLRASALAGRINGCSSGHLGWEIVVGVIALRSEARPAYTVVSHQHPAESLGDCIGQRVIIVLGPRITEYHQLWSHRYALPCLTDDASPRLPCR